MDEEIVYIVRVILPDGKNKIVEEEEYTAFEYHTYDNNNLRLVTRDGSTVIEFHNYNWISIRPK